MRTIPFSTLKITMPMYFFCFAVCQKAVAKRIGVLSMKIGYAPASTDDQNAQSGKTAKLIQQLLIPV
jgi:hypothetical protein